MKEEKCLVTEAMDRCKCKWCKVFRQMREVNTKIYVQQEMMRRFENSLKEDD